MSVESSQDIKDRPLSVDDRVAQTYQLFTPTLSEEKVVENRRLLNEYFNERFGLDFDKLKKIWNQNFKSSEEFTSLHIRRIIKAMEELEETQGGSVKTLHDKFGISNFNRYPIELLLDQYENRDDVDTPYGLVMFPINDWNRAFSMKGKIFSKIFSQLDGKCLIRIVEVDGKKQAVKQFSSVRRSYGATQKIKFGIIGGHGATDLLELGPDGARGRVTSRDLANQISENIAQLFIDRAQILLVACSTGQKKGLAQKGSHLGLHFKAPNKDTSLVDLDVKILSNGKIELIPEWAEGTNPKEYLYGRSVFAKINTLVNRVFVGAAA